MSDLEKNIEGTESLIDIEQIVASTRIALRLKHTTEYDDEIELFINEGARSLGNNRLYPKVNCLLRIVDGKVKLPSGFRKLIGFKFVPDLEIPPSDSETTLGIQQVSPRILYVEKTFLNENDSSLTTGDPVQDMTGVAEINKGYIWFTFPLTSGMTIINLSYWGVAQDDFGLILLHPDYERGLRSYAVYMMMETYPFLWPKDYQQYYNTTLERNRMTWVKQKDMIVSKDFADDFEKNKYMIKRMYQALFYNQNQF